MEFIFAALIDQIDKYQVYRDKKSDNCRLMLQDIVECSINERIRLFMKYTSNVFKIVINVVSLTEYQ